MKTRIEDVLASATPKELDELLLNIDGAEASFSEKQRIKAKLFEKAFGSTDEKHLKAPKGAFPIKRVLAAVAAAALVFGAVFGTNGYVKAKQYTEASSFLRNHDIDITELSNNEVRSVYRDIASHSFSLEKTADVLKKSYNLGYSKARSEIDIGFYQTVGEEDICDFFFIGSIYDDGSYYLNEIPVCSKPGEPSYYYTGDEISRLFCDPGASEEQGSIFGDIDHTVDYIPGIRKMRMGELVWAYALDDRKMIEHIFPVSDGIIFMVAPPYASSVEDPHEYEFSILKLSFDGEKIFEKSFTIPGNLHNDAFIDNGDGSFSLIGQGGGVGKPINPIEIYRFSADGELISTVIPDMSYLNYNYSAEYFTDFDGGYAALFTLNAFGAMRRAEKKLDIESEHLIVFFDADGNITDTVALGGILKCEKLSNDEYMSVDDICAYDNKLFISVHYSKLLNANGFMDDADPSTYSMSPENKSEALKSIRSNEISILYAYEPESGELNEVMSVPGSGNSTKTLYVDNGDLIWNVYMIEDIKNAVSMPTAYTEGGEAIIGSDIRFRLLCRMVKYRLDRSLSLISTLPTHALTDCYSGDISDIYYLTDPE